MDPLLLSIKYLFKRKDIVNNDESVDDFFENGLSFPLFISTIFGVQEIPKINKNPSTVFHKKNNNDIALHFLFQKNETIAKLNPGYESKSDKTNLLLLILTNQCFKIDINEIIAKCNLIVRSINIKFEKKSDVLSAKCLTSLLNILTDGKIHIYNDLELSDDFDNIMFKEFNQVNVPLIISKKSLDTHDQNIFLIQIEIIFDFFSEKIKQIEKSNFNDQEEEEEEEEYDDGIDKIINLKRCVEAKNDNWRNIDEKPMKMKKRKSDIKSLFNANDEAIILEEEQEEALLKTINLIGSGKFHFRNFHESVINDSIPKFVMFYLNIDMIKNVQIKQENSPLKGQTLTKKEVENIKYVVEFLSKMEIRFKILKLNFEDPLTEENSAALFYSTFLNFFYVKNYKSEIYERCGNILCTKKLFKNYDNYIELTKPRTFAALLHFYSNKNIAFNIDHFPNKTNDLEEYFTRAKIPMIINDTILNIGSGNQMADAVLYQYQIIFDAINSGPKCFVVFEIILSVIHKLMRLEVPKFDQIAKSILVKRTALDFQISRSDQYLHKIDSTSFSESLPILEETEKKSEQKTQNVLSTFKIRHKKLINSNKTSQEEIGFNHLDSFEKLCNSIESIFCCKKGIIYNKSNYKKNQAQNQQNWKNEIENLRKNKLKKINKNLLKFSKLDDSQETQLVKFSFISSQKTFVPKLYKIFCYNEGEKRWFFQSDTFQQFAIDKQINIDESKTPIVLLLNSLENDSISLMSNLINSLYPKLDSEQDMFIYSLCDKTLAMLNFYIDFNNREKSSIKPIFLLLHIPENKENLSNLQQIVFEIYTFLTLVSDLEIVILNKNYYREQFETTILINNLYQSLKTKSNEENYFSNIISSCDDTDNENDDDEEIEEEIWEDENEQNINKDEILIKNMHFNNPKTIYLINDDSVLFSTNAENYLENCQFFKSLIPQNDSEIHSISINHTDSYKAFLQCLNDRIFEKSSTFLKVKTLFNSISKIHCNSSYKNILFSRLNWKDNLKKIIISRKEEIESKLTKNNSFLTIISKINNDLKNISPSFDIDFKLESNLILSDLIAVKSRENQGFYSSELLKSAESHLKCLNGRINKQYFWNEEQMDLIKKSHSIFLKNEFFDMIQLTNSEKDFRYVYDENIDILKSQINKDISIIDEFFIPFVNKINLKKETKKQDAEQEMQKSVNYTMNETETMKEIEVVVKIDNNLTSEIEQDF